MRFIAKKLSQTEDYNKIEVTCGERKLVLYKPVKRSCFIHQRFLKLGFFSIKGCGESVQLNSRQDPEAQTS